MAGLAKLLYNLCLLQTDRPIRRRTYLAQRKAYPSDLTDTEWLILEPLIPPPKPGGNKRSVDMREIVHGIFYILRSGCAWRMLPHDLPPWQTVYGYFRDWRQAGVWEQMNAARSGALGSWPRGRAQRRHHGQPERQNHRNQRRTGV